jgi:hypothetical protein
MTACADLPPRPRLQAQFEGAVPYLHWAVLGQRAPFEIGNNLKAALMATREARANGLIGIRLAVTVIRTMDEPEDA